MGTYSATGHTTWAAGYDMTTDLNKLTLNMGTEALDSTVFTNIARNRKGGLRTVESQVEGFFQAGDGLIDPTAFDALTDLQVVSHTPTGLASDVAYFYQAKSLNYEAFGQVGEMVPFSLSAQGARGNGSLAVGAVRGRVLAAKGSISGTGAIGTAYELGAVTAGQYLYGAVHCFAIGTSFTIVIESDSDNTFGSATTRATIGSITATGGTWATRAAGAITDTWWRARVTAASGTSTVAVLAGIR